VIPLVPCVNQTGFGCGLQTTMLGNLAEHGWSQHNLFLSTDLVLALAAECMAIQSIDGLKLAGVGRGKLREVATHIRGDQIGWLKIGQSLACDQYLEVMESLRLVLNQNLFLGLEEYESHFAFYAPGTSYMKHIDRFRDNDSRTISAVIYLNEDWLPEQGGALRLHLEGEGVEDISPLACRLVLFLSAEMAHEVLPATRNRLSIAGWFKRRP
jgi:SM-20-related protein